MSRKRLTVIIAASLTAACIFALVAAPTHTDNMDAPIPPPADSPNDISDTNEGHADAPIPPPADSPNDISDTGDGHADVPIPPPADSPNDISDTSAEYTGPQIPSEAASSSNAFAIDMYRKITSDPKHKDENVFFSPFSLYIAASLVYEGARGETASQIERVFDLEPDDRMRHEIISNTSSSINRHDPHATLVTANALWLDRGFDPYQEYVDIVHDVYRADIDRLDFLNDSENGAKRINAWAGDKTQDRIPEVVTPKDVYRAASVSTNMIYFKGAWAAQFDPADTHRGTFWRIDASKAEADFMRNTAFFNYAESDLAQILQMPYEGGRLSMLVFLPSERDGIRGLEDVISAQRIKTWKEGMSTMEVTVLMPKFEMETHYELNDHLTSLGMPHAFDPILANFSGKVDLTKIPENLYVSSASQSAFVKVNEEGTEAAAVSVFIDKVTSEPPKFIADRPFIFAIQDDASGTILFMGRVSDPAK